MDAAQLRYCLVVLVVLMGVGAAVSNLKTPPTPASEPAPIADADEQPAAVLQVAADDLPPRQAAPAVSRLSGEIDSASRGAASTESADMPSRPPVSIPNRDAEIAATPRPNTEQPRRHRIADGDDLASISLRYYGTRAYAAAIYEANAALLNSRDLLPIGEPLTIPPRPGLQSFEKESPAIVVETEITASTHASVVAQPSPSPFEASPPTIESGPFPADPFQGDLADLSDGPAARRRSRLEPLVPRGD